MVAYRDGTYHVCLKVMNCPIFLSFSLDNFVSRSPQRNLDVPPTYYLVFPRWLCMLQVVRQVVEFWNFGETNRVQIPDNDRIPLFQYIAPLLPIAFKLELLWCLNVVLAVNDHELIVLNLIPILWLCPQEVFLHIHKGEAHLLALIDVPHQKKLCLHALYNFCFHFLDDVLVLGNHALCNVHLKGLHPKNERKSTSVPELFLDSWKVLIVRDFFNIASPWIVDMCHSGPEASSTNWSPPTLPRWHWLFSFNPIPHLWTCMTRWTSNIPAIARLSCTSGCRDTWRGHRWDCSGHCY